MTPFLHLIFLTKVEISTFVKKIFVFFVWLDGASHEATSFFDFRVVIGRKFSRKQRSVRLNLPPSPQRAPPNVNPVLFPGGGGFAGWVWEGGWGEGGSFQRSSAENRPITTALMWTIYKRAMTK